QPQPEVDRVPHPHLPSSRYPRQTPRHHRARLLSSTCALNRNSPVREFRLFVRKSDKRSSDAENFTEPRCSTGGQRSAAMPLVAAPRCAPDRAYILIRSTAKQVSQPAEFSIPSRKIIFKLLCQSWWSDC